MAAPNALGLAEGDADGDGVATPGELELLDGAGAQPATPRSESDRKNKGDTTH